MKLEKFKVGRKKNKIIISSMTLIIIFLISIIIYQSYALYEEKKSFNVLNGTVPTFSNENIELAYTINGKSNIESFPNKEDEYVVGNTTCENGVSANWDYEAWGLVNIVNPNKVKKVKCTISFEDKCDYEPNYEWTFAYRTLAEAESAGSSSQEYEFNIPCSGNYKVELWGAQGGDYNSLGVGGKGGYVAGDIKLRKNKNLYLYIGQSSNSYNIETFNGGLSGSGGGATDVRLVKGDWHNDKGLNSRIMVAGAGAYFYNGLANLNVKAGAGGGLKGYNGSNTFGGTQTTPGYNSANNIYSSFGKSGTGYGGGNGYYAGGNGANSVPAGGSSFISGHTGCVAITSEDDRTPRKGTNEGSCADETTDIECSKHYSGYIFTNTNMIDGNGFKWTTEKIEPAEGMPTHDGTSTMTGNSGNGYAKITYLGI